MVQDLENLTMRKYLVLALDIIVSSCLIDATIFADSSSNENVIGNQFYLRLLSKGEKWEV